MCLVVECASLDVNSKISYVGGLLFRSVQKFLNAVHAYISTYYASRKCFYFTYFLKMSFGLLVMIDTENYVVVVITEYIKYVQVVFNGKKERDYVYLSMMSISTWN